MRCYFNLLCAERRYIRLFFASDIDKNSRTRERVRLDRLDEHGVLAFPTPALPGSGSKGRPGSGLSASRLPRLCGNTIQHEPRESQGFPKNTAERGFPNEEQQPSVIIDPSATPRIPPTCQHHASPARHEKQTLTIFI